MPIPILRPTTQPNPTAHQLALHCPVSRLPLFIQTTIPLPGHRHHHHDWLSTIKSSNLAVPPPLPFLFLPPIPTSFSLADFRNIEPLQPISSSTPSLQPDFLNSIITTRHLRPNLTASSRVLVPKKQSKTFLPPKANRLVSISRFLVSHPPAFAQKYSLPPTINYSSSSCNERHSTNRFALPNFSRASFSSHFVINIISLPAYTFLHPPLYFFIFHPSAFLSLPHRSRHEAVHIWGCKLCHLSSLIFILSSSLVLVLPPRGTRETLLFQTTHNTPSIPLSSRLCFVPRPRVRFHSIHLNPHEPPSRGNRPSISAKL